MFENKITYYGNPINLIGSLATLEIFSTVVENFDIDNHCILRGRKYGQVVEQKLHLDCTTISQNAFNQGSNAFLVYKYLSFFELETLKHHFENDIHFKIYVLAHRLFDFSEAIDRLVAEGVARSRIVVICLHSHLNSKVYNETELNSNFKDQLVGHEKFLLSAKAVRSTKTAPKKSWALPFFIIQFLQLLLNPWQQTKNSKKLWVQRIFELFNFVAFQKSHFSMVARIFRHLALMSGFRFYGWIVDSYNFLVRFFTSAMNDTRVMLIKLFYFIRHWTLIPCFKFYGLFVDGYYFTLKLLRPIFYFVRHWTLLLVFNIYGAMVDTFYLALKIIRPTFYFFRHWSLMSMFKSYGLVIDLYYLALKSLRRAYYFLSHWSLMSFFMTYGLCVDLYFLTLRVAQKTFLFPFFKAYWFLEFQYEKRLKKAV